LVRDILVDSLLDVLVTAGKALSLIVGLEEVVSSVDKVKDLL